MIGAMVGRIDVFWHLVREMCKMWRGRGIRSWLGRGRLPVPATGRRGRTRATKKYSGGGRDAARRDAKRAM